MDCLVCSNLNKNKVHTYVNEAHRLLKRGGVFAVISYAEPPRRLHYFEKEELFATIIVYFSFIFITFSISKSAHGKSLNMNFLAQLLNPSTSSKSLLKRKSRTESP